MRRIAIWLGVAFFVLGHVALASDHVAIHRVTGLIAAWNNRDATAMAQQFMPDGTAIDLQGRTATGRGAIATLLTDGQSRLKLASAPSIREDNGTANVEFEVEVTNVDARKGPRVVRRFVAVLVWGPDLPGGHHPAGRYYFASLAAATPSTR
jgi:ketosteroid isomerase-like protein